MRYNEERTGLGLRRNGWLQKWLHWEVINKCLRTTRALSLLHLCVMSYLRCDYQPGKPAVGRNVAWVSQHCTLTRTHAHFYSAQLALPFSFGCTSRYATPSMQCFTAARTHTHSRRLSWQTRFHCSLPTHFSFSHKCSLLFQAWHAELKLATCAQGNHGDHYPSGRLTDRVIALW